MNLFVVMMVLLFIASTLPPPVHPSKTSLQPTAQPNGQEITGEAIRHGKKRRRNKNGLGRGKKRRKMKNSTARRFVEKQYLVHNRTLALLGGDVQKILLNTRSLTGKLPYLPLGKMSDNSLLSGSEARKAVPPVVIGLKISTERRPDEASSPVTGTEYGLDAASLPESAQINFGNALNRLLVALTNFSPSNGGSSTPCEKWLDCRKNLEDIFLGPLPSCPCSYPSEIFYEDKVWDDEQQRYYRWRDASGDSERLDIYKPGAEYCIRSLLADGSTSLAAQHCCYDRERKLITRGSGAGNPNYISPYVSQQLHEKIDLLPWKLCKGDFTRYNKIRFPNNGNHCEENPKDNIYEKQVKLAKFF